MSDLEIARRALLGLGAAAVAGPALAQVFAGDPDEIVRLWPGPPPGSPTKPPSTLITDRTPQSGYPDRIATLIGEPLMTVFRPARPNGAAILVIPGGGYIRVTIDKEGFETARRWNEAGVTAFVLRYRLPTDGWLQKADAPLQDAQRALRLIRARAAAYGVDPRRIAVMGFSAGGHVAASLCTRFEDRVYTPVDDADMASARPDLAALAYPVMSMAAPIAHMGSRQALIGDEPSTQTVEAYSPNRHVTARTPATFMFHAADDPSVPLDNSFLYFTALRAAAVPAELHVFEEGGHGFGIYLARGKPASAWPDLFLTWARRRGFIAA